jgi:hypothetical protein
MERRIRSYGMEMMMGFGENERTKMPNVAHPIA